VVLARQDASGALVAIKYLRADLLADPEFARMFRIEAAVLATVQDPNVVRLYEYVESSGGAAIVMELIDGVSLREILSRYGRTPAEAALAVLHGSLLGLAAAHRRGVVHRDYKPENVLVDGAGASKLTDFGIAARAGDRAMAAGTAAYAPPEQFGGGPASPAGDVYAATATFYECLAGHPPFTADTAEALMYRHMSEPVPLDPVPEPLRPLVIAGMAKDPAGRPADAASLVTQLRAAAGSAYGPDWEGRGRSHLGEAALLLAALWPSSAAPAVGGHAVQQVHLSRGGQPAHNVQPSQNVQPSHNVQPLQHAQPSQASPGSEHVEHLEHVRHLEHLRHLEYLGQHGQPLPGHPVPSTPAAAQGVQPAGVTGQQGGAGHGARWAGRALRQGRHGPLAGHPALAIGAAVGVVAIAAAVIVPNLGHSVPSIAGSWTQNGTTTFTFTSSGPNTYKVSELDKDAPQCAAPDDGTVTGGNRHYKGSVNLYQTSGSTTGSCEPKTGVAQIAITIAANGATADVSLVGNDCPTCGAQTWTRQS
ncbi:MAG: serine/threonine-protein kinase, partial [Streptosporangiaceae bacterium]